MEEKTNNPEAIVHAPEGVVVEVHVDENPAEKLDAPVEEAVPTGGADSVEAIAPESEAADSKPEVEAIKPEVIVHAPEGVTVEVHFGEQPVETVEAPSEEAAAPASEAIEPEKEAEITAEAEPKEEKPEEAKEERIYSTPEEMEARIAELESDNVFVREKIELCKAEKKELLKAKVDELYDEFRASIKEMNGCIETIVESLNEVSRDFSDKVDGINAAYHGVQYEKAALKSKEVK